MNGSVSKARYKIFKGNFDEDGTEFVSYMMWCSEANMQHLRHIRSAFYNYYFSFKMDDPPFLSFLAPPTIYKEET